MVRVDGKAGKKKPGLEPGFLISNYRSIPIGMGKGG